jgi:hypothetical protein
MGRFHQRQVLTLQQAQLHSSKSPRRKLLRIGVRASQKAPQMLTAAAAIAAAQRTQLTSVNKNLGQMWQSMLVSRIPILQQLLQQHKMKRQQLLQWQQQLWQCWAGACLTTSRGRWRQSVRRYWPLSWAQEWAAVTGCCGSARYGVGVFY